MRRRPRSRRLFAAVLAAALLLICAPTAQASDLWPGAPSVNAQAAVLMDASTGQILYAKNAGQRMQPASLTKIMTCLLALEQGRLSDEVTVTAESLRIGYDSTKIYLKAGEVLTLEQLLYGLMLSSGNDAANAIGVHLSGSLDAFVAQMNARAAGLGLTGTHFDNAHGLPSGTHYTTAEDLAVITRAALGYPAFRTISGTGYYQVPASSRSMGRSFTHLSSFLAPGSARRDSTVVAGKTGWTSQAGPCLMTVAERGGRTLIAVVLKSDACYSDTEALFRYGFGSFTAHEFSLAGFVRRLVPYTDEENSSRMAAISFSEPSVTVLLPAGVTPAALRLDVALPTGLTGSALGSLSARLLAVQQGRELELLSIPFKVLELPAYTPQVASASVSESSSFLHEWLCTLLLGLCLSAAGLLLFRRVRRAAQAQR